MKIIIGFLISVLCLSCVSLDPSFATSEQTQTPRVQNSDPIYLAAAPVNTSVEGVGVIVADNTAQARDQAIQDALRLAVEQAAGTMVSSETLVQNYEVLRDQVYSQSQGYIRHYEVTNETTEGNLYRVTIQAAVAMGNLKNDLAALGPRALLAATLATLMTGALAGAFYVGQRSVLGL